MAKKKMSRRDFLRGVGLAGLGATLTAAGCQPQTVIVEKEVEKVVTQVVEVEKEVTKIVAGTPVVEKVVETQVVEKLVEVTPTPLPELTGDLRVWAFPLTENDQDWLWTPMMEQFNQEYPAIDVEIELLPWGGRREKMLTAFAAGEAPSIAYVNTDTISLFGQNDILLPLDEIIPAEVWEDFPKDLAPGISWEGERIMVPTLFIVTGAVANRALMEEIGLDPENPPYEWDDVREAAAMAKAKGYFYQNQSTTNMGLLVNTTWQAGSTMLSEDTTKSLMDQPPGIEAITFLTDFYRNEWAPLEGAVGSVEEAASAGDVNYFMLGQQVVALDQNPTIHDMVARQAPDMELVLVPVYKNKKQMMMVGSGCWGIFKNTEFLKGASTWINWMIEPEHQGFYCSVTGFATPRTSASKFWTSPPEVKKHVEFNLPYASIGWDCNYWWQLQKIVGAPHWQAAALGIKTPEQACNDYAAELDAAIAEELSKQA